MIERPLILIPGMGADERIFRAQKAAFGLVRVPNWIPPTRNETLIAYARRFAGAVDPHRPCYIGGASFGGVLALEMASYLDARAVFLIGSIRSPREMAWLIRSSRPMSRLALALPFPLVRSLARASLYSAGNYSSIGTRSLLTQVADADADFLRWATRALLGWTPSAEIGRLPIHQIHGGNDRVFPASRSRADVIVPGAGHLLSVTHADLVNSFIAERIYRGA
jgi:pimeloyl-ACP methyl ester carboxylesterase